MSQWGSLIRGSTYNSLKIDASGYFDSKKWPHPPNSSCSTFPPFWHTRTQQQLTTTSLRLISLSVGWSTVVHGRAIHDLRQGLQQFLGISGTSSRSRKIASKTGWPTLPGFSRNSHYKKHMRNSTWEIIDSMFKAQALNKATKNKSVNQYL